MALSLWIVYGGDDDEDEDTEGLGDGVLLVDGTLGDELETDGVLGVDGVLGDEDDVDETETDDVLELELPTTLPLDALDTDGALGDEALLDWKLVLVLLDTDPALVEDPAALEDSTGELDCAL